MPNLIPASPFTRIGRYPVVRRLGSGAMGEVYEVEDLELGRRVALKILSAETAAVPQFRERFRREAVAMAQVRHPHVVQVFELGAHGDLPFFTLELVEGGDCATLIERQIRLEVPELARIGQQAAQGLGAAAARGLVHRDVKPANLLLHNDQVKVSDFGIAREVEAKTGLTQYGIVMGTPEYMAPEQAMGMPVDLRADIYALGISLYQLATLQLPFTGDPGAVLQMQVDRPLPSPRDFRPDLSEAFLRVLLRMLDKDPRRRPQSYDELGADLAPLRGAHQEETLDGMPGTLLFVDGPLTGRKIVLPEGEFVAGREVDCQLVLDDPQASRRHAAFVRGVTGLDVRDLGSRNGVLVNTARVTSARLRVGDLVQVGSTTFKVLSAPALHSPVVARPTSTPAPPSAPPVEGRANFLAQLAAALVDPSPHSRILQVLPELLEADPELLPVGRLIVTRWNPGAHGQVVLHEARSAADAVPPLSSAIQAVCSSGRPIILDDARVDPSYSAEAGQVARVLCAPLSYQGRVLGALYADSTTTRALTSAETSFFTAVGHLLSAAWRP